MGMIIIMVCCGAFNITSPLLCPVLLATHVIGTEIGAPADPMALLVTGRHREMKLLKEMKGDARSSDAAVPGY